MKIYCKNFLIKKKKIILIRPFLNQTRYDINNFCVLSRIPLFFDKGNKLIKYARNRIRKQLLPAIKLFFNPQIENILYQLSEILTVEQQFLNSLTSNLRTSIEKKKDNTIQCNNSFLFCLPIAIRRQFLKSLIETYISTNLTFSLLEKLFVILQNKKSNIENNDISKIFYSSNVGTKNFIFLTPLMEDFIEMEKKTFFYNKLEKNCKKDLIVQFNQGPKIHPIKLKKKLQEIPKILFFPGNGNIFLTSQNIILLLND